MKRFLTYIFFLGALGLFGYEFKGYFFPPSPCAEPIEYALGDFAPEFKITEEYFLDAIRDAEEIWEKARGQELFTYDPKAKGRAVLQVNLIYDYRQQATRELSRIGTALDENQESYDALRAEFDRLRRQYEKEKSALLADVASFRERQVAFEKEVSYWNSKGGAPEPKYDELEEERKDLEAEAGRLRLQEEDVNGMAGEVNDLVAEINKLAKKLNLAVEDYNAVSGTRGETFEEGLYIQDGTSRKINIYEFSDRAELVRLLAHELGHALDLEHVADPEAIMYELNKSENLVPTEADIAELQNKCGTEGD